MVSMKNVKLKASEATVLVKLDLENFDGTGIDAFDVEIKCASIETLRGVSQLQSVLADKEASIEARIAALKAIWELIVYKSTLKYEDFQNMSLGTSMAILAELIKATQPLTEEKKSNSPTSS